MNTKPTRMRASEVPNPASGDCSILLLRVPFSTDHTWKTYTSMTVPYGIEGKHVAFSDEDEDGIIFHQRVLTPSTLVDVICVDDS